MPEPLDWVGIRPGEDPAWQLAGPVQHLASNECLELSDASRLWIVEAGEMALYAVARHQGALDGSRRFWCIRKPGDVLGGSVPFDAGGLLAVALQDTRLRPVPLESDQAPLASWLRALDGAARFPAPATEPIRIREAGRLALAVGETVAAQEASTCWVGVVSGLVRPLGLEGITLGQGDGPIPLLEGVWLFAEAPTELLIFEPGRTADNDMARRVAQSIGRIWAGALSAHLVKQAEREAAGIADRQKAGELATHNAVAELASILSHAIEPAGEMPPLLEAMQTVGQARGVKIVRPARRGDEEAQDPVDVIARASHVRTRRVRLRGPWWKRDNGPLLAFLQADHRPVALLPRNKRSYMLFDPTEHTRVPVTDSVATRLEPTAIVLYQHLPEKTLHWRDLLMLGLASARGELPLAFAMAAGVALLNLLIPQVSYWLVSMVAPDGDRALLFEIGLALAGAGIAAAAFKLVQDFAIMRLETRAEEVTEAAMWDRLLTVRMPFFRKMPIGDLAQRMGSLGQLRRTLSGTAIQSAISALLSLIYLAQLLFYSPSMGLVALGIGTASTLMIVLSAWAMLQAIKKEHGAVGLTQGVVLNLLNGLAKIRVAHAQARAFSHWAKSYAFWERSGYRTSEIQHQFQLYTDIIPLASVMIFYRGFAGLSAGPDGPKQIAAFIGFNMAYSGYLMASLGLGSAASALVNLSSTWQRLKPLVNAPLEFNRTNIDPGPLKGGLSIVRATFRYSPEGPMVLRDVTLEINPGEFVALVGPSGSGKSTLLRIALGFDELETGKVYYDGNDLSGLDLQAVRRQLGLVLQSGRLMMASIFENIANGHLISHEQAWEAAREAGLADDIAALPMGMNMVISEGGTNLSAGQRQRLLIARALALKPKLLLFDEATSALDGPTQALVSQSLSRMRISRLVIAHRLSTIRQADRIYVLESGKVVQEGTFNELMAQEGLFARLMSRQLS